MIDVIKSSNLLKTVATALTISFLILMYISSVEAEKFHGYGGLIDVFNLLIAWACWAVFAALTALIYRIKYYERDRDVGSIKKLTQKRFQPKIYETR